jgi:hypothetical protein
VFAKGLRTGGGAAGALLDNDRGEVHALSLPQTWSSCA